MDKLCSIQTCHLDVMGGDRFKKLVCRWLMKRAGVSLADETLLALGSVSYILESWGTFGGTF